MGAGGAGWGKQVHGMVLSARRDGWSPSPFGRKKLRAMKGVAGPQRSKSSVYSYIFFILKTLFMETDFQLAAKLRDGYRDFSYPSCPCTCMALYL